MRPTARDLRPLLTPLIRDVPDFPLPGVTYKDICPLLADHAGFSAVVEELSKLGRGGSGEVSIDKVAGVEARGFMLACPVALLLGVGFVPVRKAGKLPGATYQQSYALEYGEATLEVQSDAFLAGDRVLVVDDVLATGGTLDATTALVARSGAEVATVGVLVELGFLAGRERLGHLDLHALMTV